MWKPTTQAFGAEHQSAFVKDYLERGNLEVMRPLSMLLVAVGVFGFATTYIGLDFWTPHASMIWSYRFFFLAILTEGVAFSLLARHLLSLPERPPRAVDGAVLGIVVITLGLSVWITLLGYATMGRYFYIVSALMALFGLLYIPPTLMFVSIAATFSITIAHLAYQGLLNSQQFITLGTYCVLMATVSSARYHTRMRGGQMQERILRSARHDELTDAHNRRSLDDDAPTYAGHAQHVILTDIDEFKLYNDLYGHATGDAMLKAFAATMFAAFPDGTVYRYGGDEFLAIVPAHEADDIEGRIEAWRQSFHATKIEGTHYDATCSAGICTGTPADAKELFDMIRLADMGLYEAKEGGRNAARRTPFDLERLSESAGTTLKAASTSTDALTGLPDVEFFYDHAQKAAPVMLSRGATMAFAHFNVGGLKDYNARYGFDAGDELLRSVADSIQDAFPNRLLSRIGDDRFVLMAEMGRLSTTLESLCEQVADRQVEQVVTLHAGVCRYDDPQLLVREACDHARVACDTIKGRYDVFSCLYTPELEAETKRRQRVVERFEQALAKGYIQVHYQPIVRTVSDNICEVEALARWIDPDEGMLEASSFIGALEDAGLVKRLDLHVVEEVCRGNATLVKAGLDPLPVSINLSGADFEPPSIVGGIAELLARYDMPAGLLRVEVVEGAFARDAEAMRSAVEELHALGAEVWMDDFGGGSSSMGILRTCDFDLVKLDIPLVRGLASTDAAEVDKARVMVMHLVSMAKELGTHTLAEGVEGIEELSFLRNIGCERLQGRIFSEPMSLDALVEGLSSHALMAEPVAMRSYYDAMGSVNLIRPVPVGASFDPTGTANGVPVAIVEYSRYEGDVAPSLHYLMANMPFQQNMELLATEDPAAYEELFSLGMGTEAGVLWGALDHVLSHEGWERIRLGSTRRFVFVQRVATNTAGDATALVLYTPPVRKRHA